MTVPVYALSFVSFVISRIVTKCFHFCTCTKFNVSSAVESRGLAKPGANSLICMKQLSFNTIWFIVCPLRYGEPVDDRSHRLNTHPNSAHHCIENHAEKKITNGFSAPIRKLFTSCKDCNVPSTRRRN